MTITLFNRKTQSCFNKCDSGPSQHHELISWRSGRGQWNLRVDHSREESRPKWAKSLSRHTWDRHNSIPEYYGDESTEGLSLLTKVYKTQAAQVIISRILLKRGVPWKKKYPSCASRNRFVLFYSEKMRAICMSWKQDLKKAFLHHYNLIPA